MVAHFLFSDVLPCIDEGFSPSEGWKVSRTTFLPMVI